MRSNYHNLLMCMQDKSPYSLFEINSYFSEICKVELRNYKIYKKWVKNQKRIKNPRNPRRTIKKKIIGKTKIEINNLKKSSFIKFKRHSRSSESSSSSTESSRSASPVHNRSDKTAKESMNDFFKSDQSKANYYLSQKSEMLLFDTIKEPEEKTENFVWRKKNQQIGIDKLDPQKVLMMNRIKQEETAVCIFLFFEFSFKTFGNL